MRKDPKKIVAAAMGVIEYLRAEAERGREEQRAGMRTAPPIAGPPVQPAVSPWAASGRMELMRFRNLMELRIFRWHERRWRFCNREADRYRRQFRH